MVKFRKYNKLNEELGISKEVQQELLKIINRINKLLSQKQSYTVYYLNDRTEPAVYGINTIEYPLLFGDFPVYLRLQIYFCNGQDDYDNLAKQVKNPEWFSFNDNKDEIIIRYPIIRSVNFDFDINDVQIVDKTETIYGSLSHELKHAYQKDMLLRNTDKERLFSRNKRDAYTNILTFLHKEKREDNEILYDLVYEFYYLYTQEITANIESLYTMTLRNADNIDDALGYVKNSQMYRFIMMMQNDYEYIKNGAIDKEIEEQLKLKLNVSINWLIHHMEKGLKFAYKKFRQLEKLLRKTYTH